MAGIFSDISVGALVVRDPDTGLPVNQPNTFGVLVPDPEFTIDCDMTALPEDCNVRPQNKQINAIVSEIVNFAATLDPDGNWDCDNFDNLSVAFEAWVAAQASSDIGDELCAVAVGPGSETGAALIYCDGTDAKKLLITGNNSLMTLVNEFICNSTEQAPTNNADYIIFCRNGAFYKFRANTWQNYVGPWVQARSYTVNNLVRVGNLLYAPNAAIPSGTPFTIGTSGATWFEVSPTVTPPYDESAGYSQDTIISYNGKFYAANADIPPDTPFVIGTTGLTWREVDFTQAFILEFNTSKTYQTNSVFTVNGEIWRAQAILSPGAFNPAGNVIKLGGDRNIFWGEWDQAHNSTEFRTTSQFQYLQGDVVVRNALLYRANGNIPLNTAFAIGTGATQWTEISASVAPPFDPDISYSQDAVIYKDGQYYAANADIPAGTPFVIGTTGQTWRLVNASSPEILLKDYDTGKTYQPRSLIYRDQAIWMRTATASAGPWNETQWQLVGERSRYRGVFSTGLSYLTNDVVSLDAGSASTMQMPTGTLVRATTNVAIGAFNAAQWAVINRSSPMRGAYDQTYAYSSGDLVFTDFGVYRANGTIASGTPFAVGISGATWATANAVRVPGAITATATTAVNDFADSLLRFTAATAKTFTIPPQGGTFQLPIGTTISGLSTGGQLTIVAGSGVTIRSRGGLVLDAVDYATFTLTKLAANEWLLTGDFA